MKNPMSAGNLLLLVAPVASGKTSFLLNLVALADRPIIYLSPLRALAQEFFERARLAWKNTYWVDSQLNCDEHNFVSKKKLILVSTVESFQWHLLDKLKGRDPLIVLDEFHLFYYWGTAWRPKLFDALLRVADSGVNVLAMTATWGPKVQDFLTKEMVLGFARVVIFHRQGMPLNRLPKNIIDFSVWGGIVFKLFFLKALLTEKKTILYFCRYRERVQILHQIARKFNIDSLYCLGGEVSRFQADLQRMPNPRVIFSTTALSHGVNLPEISKVFIEYPVEQYDFWIQMIGRAGRRGNEFKVYTFDHFKIKEQNLELNSSTAATTKDKLWPWQLKVWFYQKFRIRKGILS